MDTKMADSPSQKIDAMLDAKNALREAETALALAIQSKRLLGDEYRRRVAELAHEIKTPLTAMMGFAEILKDERLGPLGNQKYVEHAATVYAAANHILSVCENVLTAALPDEPDDTIPLKKVDVRELFAEMISQFGGMAKERGVKLRSRVADGFPILRTDPVRLKQVLYNVLSNAIKFTPAGGRVSIKAEVCVEDGAVILVIQDQGRGIPDAKIVEMLKPYRHDPMASPHGDTGSGLGLSKSVSIMAELGGRLELRSVLNVGSVVTLHLPKEAIQV